MTTAHSSTGSPASTLGRAVDPSGRAEVRAADTQAARATAHTGLSNEKLESMLLRMHAQAQAPKAVAAGA
ncbi:hypothetical protein [Acidovorax sp. A1169]|uniref:hypothetical protein n=1 Tax=Acidovorax sp. A1169 TaxID=3059524 RepID=UPI0027379960|nr:hypothetical protein [Acidovorax sp. A1169]MDP4074638.1 hypothetical protein [Acidovorax sp. A1169]